MAISVSVITPARNSASTIEATLHSVATQTWRHREHILIDGGSTDATLSVAARYPHLTHIVSEPDDGIYDAMNKGLRHASGDVVAFLNADDYYVNEFVLSRVASVFGSGAAVAVFGDVEFFDPREPQRAVRRYNSGRFSPSRLRWGWMPAHPAFFCRRDLFKRVGSFSTSYRIAADFEWMTRAFTHQAVEYQHLSEVLVRMRIGGVSTAGLRSTLTVTHEMLRACRQNGLRTNLAMLLARYPWKLAELSYPRHRVS